MRTIKITDQDSTNCGTAYNSIDVVGSYAAVPDWVLSDTGIVVNRKYHDIVLVDNQSIKAFIGDDPITAINSALDDLIYDNVPDKNDRGWWILT
jgi:hypothetical protein